MKLIVTADDFGLTEGINKGIIDSYRNGIVTRASLIANGNAFDHAVSLAKESPGLEIGVHLTLVEEIPVSDIDSIKSLIQRGNNKLPANYRAFVLKYFLKQINLREVEIELENQIKKIIQSGIKINHVDSHQHLHMLPGVFGVTIKLAQKHHIRKIRISMGYTPKLLDIKTLLLNYLAYLNRKKLDGYFQYADYCLGLYESGNLKKSDMLNFLETVKEGTTEIISHPGFRDGDFQKKYGYWHYNPEIDHNTLTDQEIREKIAIGNINLVS